MRRFFFYIAIAASVLSGAIARADKPADKGHTGPGCGAAPDDYFVNEVWAKVGSQVCMECHRPGGDAEDSHFILEDPERASADHDKAMRHNRDMFVSMALKMEGDQSRMLLKVVGNLKHGGKQVVKPNSKRFAILAEFVRRLKSPTTNEIIRNSTIGDKAHPFLEGVVMLDDRRLLRRATLSLAGRLPTAAELASIDAQGSKALPAILDVVMKEEAFYDRIREAFNDIFLTVGFEGNPETVLAYDHFSKTRGWPEKYDLSSAGDKAAQQKARYKLYDTYRQTILQEPMRLVEYIVRNDHPFTEVVTADYMMVSPYSARGYGIFDTIKSQFKNPEDPFEYVPTRLPRLTGRTKDDDEDSPTGYYAHAGLLTTFQYLRRFPTTETNRNRLRARMFYQQFLGIDVLELAARVTDAAAVQAKFAVPTMQASECVICHKTIDPVAGLFQDYWRFEGVYGKRKGGWFKDMFPPGYEGEDMPADQRWRALQWLGGKTSTDPRFAAAMVEHVYYVLTGRKTLANPKDIEDPLFTPRRRAYLEQRREIDAIARRFSSGGFNLKSVFKDWIASDFYRADGLAWAVADPNRRGELEDLGVTRMLAPEQIERKITAIFGKPWGQMHDQIAMLYGGIDSKEVTERAADPSGAMGAIQRIMSNDVACKNTALDFSRPAAGRRLFPNIEPSVTPGASAADDAKIRQAISYLHERILGRHDAPDSPEVARTFGLFSGIVSDAATHKFDPRENYYCRREVEGADPKYTVRAWRAVLTYLLRRREFLYE